MGLLHTLSTAEAWRANKHLSALWTREYRKKRGMLIRQARHGVLARISSSPRPLAPSGFNLSFIVCNAYILLISLTPSGLSAALVLYSQPAKRPQRSPEASAKPAFMSGIQHISDEAGLVPPLMPHVFITEIIWWRIWQQ